MNCRHCLQRQCDGYVAIGQRLELSPEAGPHAVFVPRPVRHVGNNDWPIGGLSTVRGIAFSIRHSSTLRMTQTASFVLPGSVSFGRSTCAWFFEIYTKRAVEAKVDPLGYYLAPFGSHGQLSSRPSRRRGRLIKRPSQNICAKTSIRPSFAHRVFGGRRAQGNRDAASPVPGRGGQEHRAVPRPGKQVVLFPEKLKSGDLISPFEAARK